MNRCVTFTALAFDGADFATGVVTVAETEKPYAVFLDKVLNVLICADKVMAAEIFREQSTTMARSRFTRLP